MDLQPPVMKNKQELFGMLCLASSKHVVTLEGLNHSKKKNLCAAAAEIPEM